MPFTFSHPAIVLPLTFLPRQWFSPSIALANTTYNASVFGSWNGPVSWSISPFGGVATTTGSNSANLVFYTQGTKTVTATATDICTGQASSVSKQVNVQ